VTPSAGGREEYLLELVNRMRGNPAAELPLLLNSGDADVQSALAFLHVDRTLLSQQWQALAPRAPVAWNDALGAAALTHSQLMLTYDQQSHVLPGESDPGPRLANAGYALLNTFSWGENVYAYSKSVFYAHAGMAVDWGSGPGTSGGIQSPPEHRANIMSPTFREVGFGLVNSTPGKTTGPLLVTQDFGSRSNQGNAFVLGVAYADANRNGCYDVGEGLPGATVTLRGAAGTFSTTTTAAGGYQLQVPNGNYSLTVSGAGLTNPPQVVTVNGANVHFNLVRGGGAWVAASFPHQGVWRYSGLGWQQLSSTDASAVAADDAGEVAAIFPGYGVYRYQDATGGWQLLSNTSADLVSIAGGIVAAQFPGHGVYRYQDGAGWRGLATNHASALGVDPFGDVAAAFTGLGVWLFEDATGWRQLASNAATGVSVAGHGVLAAAFTGLGVWRYQDGAGWVRLTSVSATSVAVDASGDVAAALAGYGVWRYKAGVGWQLLASNAASRVAIDSLGDVAGQFAGSGVWRYRDGSGWQQLAGPDASSIDA
jgi:hypothetical protein